MPEPLTIGALFAGGLWLWQQGQDSKSGVAFTQTLEANLQPYGGAIYSSARKYNVDPYTIAGIIKTESDGNASAVGDGGNSIGLGQIDLAFHPEYTREDLLDPVKNIDAICKIYADCLGYMTSHNIPGAEVAAIAAYNCGNAHAAKAALAGDYDRYTTNGYTSRVLGYRSSYVANFPQENA